LQENKETLTAEGFQGVLVFEYLCTVVDNAGFLLLFVRDSLEKSPIMRQRFEQQINLRTVPISDVRFSLKSRDELPPIKNSYKR
jgi:hypothetical protein